MKHWTPRIADAAERAVGTGATTVVGLVLAPHYSRGSIAGYREQLEKASTAVRSSRSSTAGTTTRRSSRSSPTASAARARTSSSLLTRCRNGSSTAAIPTSEQLLETSQLVAEAAGVRRMVVLVPIRVADRRTVAPARHPRAPRDTARPGRPLRARLPRRLRLRPPRDPLGPRRRGGGAGCRAGHGVRSDRHAECRSGVRCASSRASSAGWPRYRLRRDGRTTR